MMTSRKLIAALVLLALVLCSESEARRSRGRRMCCSCPTWCSPCAPACCAPSCCAPSCCSPCPAPTCCSPCGPQVCTPCDPVRTYRACICPYYDMGTCWYAEFFEWDDNNPFNCDNGLPIPHDNGPQSFCQPPDCGCIPVSAAPGATVQMKADSYLDRCIKPDTVNPPKYGDGQHPLVEKVTGPHHLRIRRLDGAVPTRTIHVAYYHMKTRPGHGGPVQHFWIGYECEDPGTMGRQADATTAAPGIVTVGSGGSGPGQNNKRIIISLTENGCQ